MAQYAYKGVFNCTSAEGERFENRRASSPADHPVIAYSEEQARSGAEWRMYHLAETLYSCADAKDFEVIELNCEKIKD
jgi:hypothetical protein